MLPSVNAFLTYIIGLKPKGKLWAFFGSYGWAGGAIKKMTKIVKEAGFEAHDPLLNFSMFQQRKHSKNASVLEGEIAEKIKR